jgi:hypothetical protein
LKRNRRVLAMPQLQQLTEEQIQQTFRRAQEISGKQHDALPGTPQPEVAFAPYIEAAEEMGISREAILLALRETNLLPDAHLAVGDRVFAPSLDGCSYPAEIVRYDGVSAMVEFINGGQRTVAVASLKPFDLVPGREVQYDEKEWGWMKATVRSYDPASGKVEINSGWETKRLPLGAIRLTPPKTERELKVRQLLLRASLVSGTVGIALGYWLAHLLH